MDDARLSNLVFLASVAALAMPGCDKSGEPNPRSVNAPSGNPLESDAGLTGPDSPGALPGSGGDSAACSQYAARMVECGNDGYYAYDEAQFLAQCRYLLDYAQRYFGSGCAESYAEFFACVGAQDCQSFACSDEEEAVDRACGGVVEDVGTTGF